MIQKNLNYKILEFILHYIFYTRIYINKLLIPFLVKFNMFNLLSYLLIFNLSKIKKILPPKKTKYRVLVLSKSAGIDDLIESQKKYNSNILYLECPRFFFLYIYQAIFKDHPEISDVKYFSNKPEVKKLKIKYKNFLVSFLKIFKKKYYFHKFIGFNFIYRAERELHAASRELKIPFSILFKECVLTESQKNCNIFTYKKNKEKSKAYKIAVYSSYAKKYLIKANIIKNEKIKVIGCPRLAISFSYKKFVPKNQILYYAIENYRGLPNPYFKIFGKSFYKDYKQYTLSNSKFNWRELHIKTLKLLKDFAIKNPKTSIIIKTKTGDKYVQTDYSNLPKNIKIYKSGVGHVFLKDSKVVIGWNSTAILEAIAANRFILLPYFFKKNKFSQESELKLGLKKENYGYSENDFLKKLNFLFNRKYVIRNKYNNLNSLDYYLGNSKNDAGLRLNKFLTNNLNYKDFE